MGLDCIRLDARPTSITIRDLSLANSTWKSGNFAFLVFSLSLHFGEIRMRSNVAKIIVLQVSHILFSRWRHSAKQPRDARWGGEESRVFQYMLGTYNVPRTFQPS